MRRIGTGNRDRYEIFNQPIDIGLTPAVTALPARHDVLHLSVQQFKELDRVGIHGLNLFCEISGALNDAELFGAGCSDRDVRSVRRSILSALPRKAEQPDRRYLPCEQAVGDSDGPSTALPMPSSTAKAMAPTSFSGSSRFSGNGCRHLRGSRCGAAIWKGECPHDRN